jgi:hypothetical protein
MPEIIQFDAEGICLSDNAFLVVPHKCGCAFPSFPAPRLPIPTKSTDLRFGG